MSKIEKYRKEVQLAREHYYVVSFKGIILETSISFMPNKKNISINHIHPFFESFFFFVDSKEEKLIYNCVHLNEEENNFITDVHFLRKEDVVFVIIQDFTEQYNSYQEVAQGRNESIIKSELIVLKNEELKKREEFKNIFIQNFSHELRNPLTSILSITKLLADTELKQEQKEMVMYLLESNSNLKLMLEDILSISIIASNKLELRENAFDLDKLINLVDFTYTAKAKEKDLNFVLKKTGKLPTILEGDRLRLFQVITNLLDNAIKFTTSGTISLSIQLNQKRANKVNLRFSVADTGVGISLQDQETIFESFVQLQKDGKKEGTGLGLAIVYGLLEKMGSQIKVVSEVGLGTEFFFDITFKQPIRVKESMEVKGIDKDIVALLKAKNNKKFKLLIVEDDVQVQTVLFKLLMNTECFYLDLVNDGAKVLQEVINTSYDLILMDVDLPNIAGNHIVRLIRDFPLDSINKIPIIGLTGSIINNKEKEYKKDGMNAVISKPFDTQVLLKTIFRYLNKI